MLRLDPTWVAPVLDYTHQGSNESSIEVHAGSAETTTEDHFPRWSQAKLTANTEFFDNRSVTRNICLCKVLQDTTTLTNQK